MSTRIEGQKVVQLLGAAPGLAYGNGGLEIVEPSLISRLPPCGLLPDFARQIGA